MKLEDQLKQMMVEKYGSVRAFSIAAEISNSTVDSALKRGIQNSGVGTVLKIFQVLGVDEKTLVADRIIMIGEEKENPPAPSEDSTGGQFSKLEIETVLVSLGFIKDGEHITDSDLRFINGILDIIDAWFENRNQKG